MKLGDRLRRAATRVRRELRVLRCLSRDPDLPRLPKFLAALTVAYALSPIDLIPDFIPVLGHLDDLILLPLLGWLCLKSVPAENLERARLRAASHPGDGA